MLIQKGIEMKKKRHKPHRCLDPLEPWIKDREERGRIEKNETKTPGGEVRFCCHGRRVRWKLSSSPVRDWVFSESLFSEPFEASLVRSPISAGPADSQVRLARKNPIQ